MARLAVVYNTVMIEAEGRREAFGGMARSTIGCCYGVVKRGRLGGRINTGAVVVAGFTRLHHGVNHAVVENTTRHLETDDTVARVAIHVRYRMADRLTQCRTRAISNMTGITCYTRTRHVRAGMIGIGIQETGRSMAVTAF